MLLNFDGVQSFLDIKSRFVEIASSIMLSHDLIYGEPRWKITALELYLFTEQSNVWRDGNTHRSDEQLNSGSWYVHKYGHGQATGSGKWKAPNWSGLDITAGSRSLGIYAGLLVRELDQKDGSATAFKTIIRGKPLPRENHDTWSPHERKIIDSIDGKSVTAGPLRLEACPQPRTSDLWIGPRILNPKLAENIIFKAKPLRVATWRTKRLSTLMEKITEP